MKLDIKQLKTIADLAALDIEEGELDEFREDLEDILDYVDQINEYSEEEVDPRKIEVDQTKMREDNHVSFEGWSKPEELLEQAEGRENDYFKSDKII